MVMIHLVESLGVLIDSTVIQSSARIFMTLRSQEGIINTPLLINQGYVLRNAFFQVAINGAEVAMVFLR